MYQSGHVLDENPTGNCDDCETKAFIKVVGEVDSFGHESITWCKECYDNYLDYRKNQMSNSN